jgi:hypothetical protein
VLLGRPLDTSQQCTTHTNLSGGGRVGAGGWLGCWSGQGELELDWTAQSLHSFPAIQIRYRAVNVSHSLNDWDVIIKCMIHITVGYIEYWYRMGQRWMYVCGKAVHCGETNTRDCV